VDTPSADVPEIQLIVSPFSERLKGFSQVKSTLSPLLLRVAEAFFLFLKTLVEAVAFLQCHALGELMPSPTYIH